MIKHNNRCTGLDYMEETLSHLALQGWYNIDSAKVLNLLSTTDKLRNTCRARLLRVQHCQEEPFFRPVSQQVHHLRETHVCGVSNLPHSEMHQKISEFPSLASYSMHKFKRTGDKRFSGLVLRYDQNVLIDSIFIKLHNGLLYYRQPFHCPTSVEHLGLDWKVEYTNANQGNIPESRSIWV